MRKPIKTFRITPENQKELKEIAEYLNRSEGWIINMALSEYVSNNLNWEKTKSQSPNPEKMLAVRWVNKKKAMKNSKDYYTIEEAYNLFGIRSSFIRKAIHKD